MSKRAFPVALLSIALLAGCLGGVDDPDDGGDPPLKRPLPVWEDGVLRVDVDVPVLLIGFEPSAAALLAMALEGPEAVSHWVYDYPMTWPPELDTFPQAPPPQDITMPVVPTAHYRVTPIPPALEEGITENLDDWAVSGSIHEGRNLEDFLAEEGPGNGITFEANAPSIVLVNGKGLKEGLQWRYTMPNGYLQPVSAFGEREPMHIIDPGAAGFDLDSLEDIEDLAVFVREATHYRILQGPIYPVPIAECHALTLVTAYRPTALTEITPTMKSALELLDPDAIAGSFRNLTGTTVHVDVINLMLPVDDPVLDAMARGEGMTSEQQRWWFMENWDRYWVPHDGCEAYVSWLIHTDTASPSLGLAGLGTYDHAKGYRIALSWVNELFRLLSDPDSPLSDGQPGLEEYNFVNYLHAHEAGHIFGMMHPHHLLRDGVQSRPDFEDVWSVMSYSTWGRVIDFGVIEQANFQRARTAFLFQAADDLERANETAFQDALALASEYRWNDASALLWDLVKDDVERVGGNLRADGTRL